MSPVFLIGMHTIHRHRRSQLRRSRIHQSRVQQCRFYEETVGQSRSQEPKIQGPCPAVAEAAAPDRRGEQGDL